MTKIIYGCATLLFAVIFLAQTDSMADETSPRHSPCNDESCGLELFSEAGTSLFAPIMDTVVEINVSGSAIHTSLKQTFTNPTDSWVEGIYSYPLPTGAAVNQLQMKIGDRVIIGEIKERQAAKRRYLQAKASGKKASLVNSHRPNLFTTKLANLGPNESVEVRIEYFVELPLTSGSQQLRFPMVVGPRYTPGPKLSDDHETLSSDTLPAINTLEDKRPEHHPHTLRINLNLGVALHAIHSLYHPVHIKHNGDTNYLVQLSEGSAIPDRDFVLAFTPAQHDNPQTALLSERKNGFHYGLFMVMPPKAKTSAILPREVTFILDRSGSMGGTSIVQAKAALSHALQQLTNNDRFNVIWFNGNHGTLFPSVVPATPGNLARARAVVSQLQASGGTEMLGALHPALTSASSSNHVPQVIFITDGNVSNEQGLFKFIENNLGERRLFTIGIGSAPNQYFLQHAARLGRGIHTSIGDTREVENQMNALFKKLSQPMLRDLKITFESDDIEFWPQTIPDLYADEPLAISFRTRSAATSIELSGKLPTSHWASTATLNGGQQRRGVAELWAKRKIATLLDDHRRSNNPEAREKIRDRIIQTALSHHLVSKFTSLVAVEKTPSNTTLAPNKTGKVPRHRPHGWTLGSSNTQLPQTGTDARLRITLGLLILTILISACVRQRLNTPMRCRNTSA